MISLPKIFAAALVASSAVIAALSPQEIVDNLRTLTAEVEDMTNSAKYINDVNAPLVVTGSGPVPVCAHISIDPYSVRMLTEL